MDNSPKFAPAKLSCYTVISGSHNDIDIVDKPQLQLNLKIYFEYQLYT